MLKCKHEGGISMIANINELDLKYLDDKRTMKLQMWNLIFNKMMVDKDFETISIKSWANIPGSRHLIKEYKEFRKKEKKQQKLMKIV